MIVSRLRLAAVVLLAVASSAGAQVLQVRPLTERVVATLPSGTLYWHVETFDRIERAQAAGDAYTLVVESDGRAWLFSLGAKDRPSRGGDIVAEVGPIPRVRATRWLLRINDASGAPGAVTPVHSHPGSEAFLVLEGEQSIRGAHGTQRVAAGASEAGHGADMAMEVSSSGARPLHALVMFVVDADRPFSTPATLP